jgi:hypothetical protein
LTPLASLEAGLLPQVDFLLLYVLAHRDRYSSRVGQAFLEMLNAAPAAKRRK